MTRNSCATSSASRLEVGSSRISTSAWTSMARAMATSCWTASEYVPSSALTSMSRSQPREQLAGAPAHRRASAIGAEPAGLAAEEDVLGHGEVRAEVDLLVDGADPGGLRPAAGRRSDTLLAVERDRARVDAVDAGQHLDQGRLAGAVLAHQGVHLAGEQPEVDAVRAPAPRGRSCSIPVIVRTGRLDRVMSIGSSRVDRSRRRAGGCRSVRRSGPGSVGLASQYCGSGRASLACSW